MPELTITGTVIKILPAQSGTSQAGKEWSKQDFVIETTGQYPKKVCFTRWKDPLDIKIGDDVTVSFDPESREYNDKWYTDLKAWKIEGGSGPDQSEQDKGVTGQKVVDTFGGEVIDKPTDADGDELPF